LNERHSDDVLLIFGDHMNMARAADRPARGFDCSRSPRGAVSALFERLNGEKGHSYRRCFCLQAKHYPIPLL
jgi:hypothetical protein